MKTPCILVVDDEDFVRDVTVMILEARGWRVESAASGMEAVVIAKREGKSLMCAVIDYSMPEWDGYTSLLRLREVVPALGAVMISGLVAIPEIEVLRRAGAVEFLAKPFEDVQLLEAVQRAMKAHV